MKISNCLNVLFTAVLALTTYHVGFKEGQIQRQKVLVKTVYISQEQAIIQNLIKEKDRLLERSRFQDDDSDIYKITLDHINKINILLDKQKCTK